MSFDGIKRAALERITAGSEGARLIGSQLTGYTSQHIQGLLAEIAARVLPSGGTTGQALTKSSNTDYAVGWSSTGGSSQPFPDNTALVKNNTDATKLLRVDASGVATATTRVLTMPNANVDLGALTDSNIAAANKDGVVGTASLRTLGTGAQQSAPGNDARFDDMLRVSATEVSVTGATTLTSTAFGKMHNCSGTSADYTVNLPTAVGNGGKIIAFRGDSALTKVVTLDANSTETIGGNLTKAIVARQKVIIVSDGSNWYILHDYRLPPKTTVNNAWSFTHTATAGNINTFVSNSNLQITVPALGPAPEGYSWNIYLSGATRWTSVPSGSPLLLISFDGSQVNGGTLWPGNQTVVPFFYMVAPSAPDTSTVITARIWVTIAGGYNFSNGYMVAQPVLV